MPSSYPAAPQAQMKNPSRFGLGRGSWWWRTLKNELPFDRAASRSSRALQMWLLIGPFGFGCADFGPGYGSQPDRAFSSHLAVYI